MTSIAADVSADTMPNGLREMVLRLPRLNLIDHALAKDALRVLRARDTELKKFREYTERLTTILNVMMLSQLPTEPVRVTTPLDVEVDAVRVTDDIVVFVGIIRAANSIIEPDLLPKSKIGQIVIQRDEETAEAKFSLAKVPNVDDKIVMVMDPMLATGGSAIRAIQEILKHGTPREIRFGCIIAAPEGIKALLTAFDNLTITTFAVDERLNEIKFIVPGLGDFGDRWYGTN